jgi:hypothetical protein
MMDTAALRCAALVLIACVTVPRTVPLIWSCSPHRIG